MKFVNFHTHRPANNPDEKAIFCCDYDEIVADTCSVGLHPWSTIRMLESSDFLEQAMGTISSNAMLPQVVAIGECGIDPLHGAELDIQIQAFRMQAEIAERVRKPMIIHCVKRIDEMLMVRKKVKAKQPWILHGYRGRAGQAGQLIECGLQLSFGLRHDPESLALAYKRHVLWLETDMSETTIDTHYSLVAEELGIPLPTLQSDIINRAKKLFPSLNP